ncbi:MAG: hypothetical protein K0R22_1178 [Sporomusa sp.]|nr:hypothetical protein [Sporomusa sp.]
MIVLFPLPDKLLKRWYCGDQQKMATFLGFSSVYFPINLVVTRRNVRAALRVL